MVVLTSAGALSRIADPGGAPATLTAIDTGVVGIVTASASGHVAYAKSYNEDADLTDLLSRRWDATTAACTLTTSVNVFYPGVRFSDDAAAVAWLQVVSPSVIPANYTRTADCMNTVFAPDAFAAVPMANRALVSWEGVDRTLGVGTLRSRAVTAGGVLATGTGTEISAGVGTFDVGDPAPGVVLYTVNQMGATDGLYVRWLGP